MKAEGSGGETPDGLMLVATKCIRADAAGEWARWYADEYLAALVGGPVAGATRWRLADAPPPGGPGPGHTHVTRVDLRGDAVDGARTLARRVEELRRDGSVHPAHAETAASVWAAHGPPVEPLETDTPRTAMIVAEVMCTDPAREAEWDRWYDDTHLPDMLGSGVFVAASRWIRAPRKGIGCDHLTVYEVSGADAATAVARSAGAMPGLIAAGRKHECHTGGPTMALDAPRSEAE